jgi:hypothetical protein
MFRDRDPDIRFGMERFVMPTLSRNCCSATICLLFRQRKPSSRLFQAFCRSEHIILFTRYWRV